MKNNGHKLAADGTAIRAAFDVLKKAVATATVLRFPDFAKPFVLATDASLSGVGAVLYQPIGDERPSVDNVVAFSSSSLQPHQRRYNVYRRELLAVLHGLRAFRHYLFGIRFTLETDHRSLLFMQSHQHELSDTLSRWWDEITQFSFEVRHIPGATNLLPDALSRLYDSSPVWGFQPSATPDESQGAEETRIASSRFDKQPPESMSSTDSVPNVVPQLPIERANWPSDSSPPTTGLDGLTVAEAQRAELQQLLGKRIPSPDERTLIIEAIHDQGHKGIIAIARTLYLDRNLWWPHMRTDIESVVANCAACQRFTVVKAGYHPARSPSATLPMDWLQIDLCLSLPTTSLGHRYALV